MIASGLTLVILDTVCTSEPLIQFHSEKLLNQVQLHAQVLEIRMCIALGANLNSIIPHQVAIYSVHFIHLPFFQVGEPASEE